MHWNVGISIFCPLVVGRNEGVAAMMWEKCCHILWKLNFIEWLLSLVYRSRAFRQWLELVVTREVFCHRLGGFECAFGLTKETNAPKMTAEAYYSAINRTDTGRQRFICISDICRCVHLRNSPRYSILKRSKDRESLLDAFRFRMATSKAGMRLTLLSGYSECHCKER